MSLPCSKRFHTQGGYPSPVLGLSSPSSSSSSSHTPDCSLASYTGPPSEEALDTYQEQRFWGVLADGLDDRATMDEFMRVTTTLEDCGELSLHDFRPLESTRLILPTNCLVNCLQTLVASVPCMRGGTETIAATERIHQFLWYWTSLTPHPVCRPHLFFLFARFFG